MGCFSGETPPEKWVELDTGFQFLAQANARSRHWIKMCLLESGNKEACSPEAPQMTTGQLLVKAAVLLKSHRRLGRAAVRFSFSPFY